MQTKTLQLWSVFLWIKESIQAFLKAIRFVKEKNMAKGIIYIMTTCVEGLIKIGKTKDRFDKRMTELEQNGYKNVTGLQRYYAIEVNDYDEKEKLLHTIFSKSQVASSELFALDKHIAKQLLESFDGEQVFPNKKTVQTMQKTKKASKLRLADIGISNGSKLTYIADTSITCNVVDNVRNLVDYQGNVYSMSGLIKFLKNDGQDYQGSYYLTFKGKRLTDIRVEKGI